MKEFISPEPVSYTHLDVYKRQTQSSQIDWVFLIKLKKENYNGKDELF